MAKKIKRAFVLVHLYLGLVLCLVFAIWFVSGIAMIYYRTPVLDAIQRVSFEQPLGSELEFARPAELTGLVADWSEVEELSAGTFQGRPLYRWRLGDGQWRSGWADDGCSASFDAERLAPAAFSWFGGEAAFRYSGSFDENSQWTFFREVRGHLPLHRFTTGHSLLRNDVYFSSQTGEPLITTSPTSRLLYVLGPGLHYASFYPIRNRNQLWRDLVNWTSSAGVLLAVTGVVLGLWRIRWQALGTYRRKIPFTRFWMRWHHIVGLVVAVPTFTFVLSGLFSMNPGGMFPRTAVSETLTAAYQGPRAPIAFLPPADAGVESLGFAPRRIEYRQRDGTFHLLAHANGQTRQRVSLEDGTWQAQRPFSKATLTEHFENLGSKAVLRAEWLEHYDNYYYSRKERYRPLPVLRLILDDPKETWLYIEPTSGEFLRQTEQGSRVQRWVYNGLHSLDPQFLLNRPWLWTFVIWFLSLGGLVLSVTGVTLSWNWLSRRIPTPRTSGVQRAPLSRGFRT